MERAAERGNETAKAQLQGPSCPQSLRYLLVWCYELHGRSGVGMSGLNPLTWETLGAWSRLTGSVPDGEDTHALFLLDATLLNPAEPKE